MLHTLSVRSQVASKFGNVGTLLCHSAEETQARLGPSILGGQDFYRPDIATCGFCSAGARAATDYRPHEGSLLGPQAACRSALAPVPTVPAAG